GLERGFGVVQVEGGGGYGNGEVGGVAFLDVDLGMAANRVILTAERIVSNDQIRRAPDQTKIPFMAVEAVVEAPFGSAPHECYGLYEPLFAHLDAYAAGIRRDPQEGARAFLERYFFSPKSWPEYPHP